MDIPDSLPWGYGGAVSGKWLDFQAGPDERVGHPPLSNHEGREPIMLRAQIDDEDLAYIVHACNNFPDLYEFCKRVSKFMVNMDEPETQSGKEAILSEWERLGQLGAGIVARTDGLKAAQELREGD